MGAELYMRYFSVDTTSSVFALAIARCSRTDRSLPEENAEFSVLPPSTAMDRMSDLPYNCEVWIVGSSLG